jgi:hypothetical protein
VVSRRKPAPGKHEDLQLDVHHLFDAHTQPYLAALDVLHNELGHFQGSASTQNREERRQQQLMQSLELLQARFEGNHLLY